MTHVLIVYNDQPVEKLKGRLAALGMHVTVISYDEDVVFLIERESFDVVVLDARLSDPESADLLAKLKRSKPTLEVIVYTNYVTVHSAVECMKQGASDVIVKPCSSEKLIDAIRNAHKNKRRVECGSQPILEKCPKSGHATSHLIGESEGMRKTRDFVDLVAPSRAPVLVLGETGTGKELVARAIHGQGPCHQAPLVIVNASVLQENILESELFGYKKGAFTDARSDKKGLLEVANNGTCFIDEVGDMGLNVQAKVLRVFETGIFMKLGDTRETKVNIRFIFATNKDLMSSVENGSFRKDLFYRINTFPIVLLPLRERREDIALLSNYFLKQFCQEEKRLSEKVVELLVAYDWPGNVRELANVIQRSTLVSGARQMIIPNDLPENIIHAITSRSTQEKPEPMGEMSLAKGKRELVAKIIDFAEGNKTKAARLLRVSRTTLYRNLALRGD